MTKTAAHGQLVLVVAVVTSGVRLDVAIVADVVRLFTFLVVATVADAVDSQGDPSTMTKSETVITVVGCYKRAVLASETGRTATSLQVIAIEAIIATVARPFSGTALSARVVTAVVVVASDPDAALLERKADVSFGPVITIAVRPFATA